MDRKNWIAFFAYTALLGGSPVALRMMYSGMAPFWVGCMRYLLAAAAFWGLVIVNRQHIPKGRGLLGPGALELVSLGEETGRNGVRGGGVDVVPAHGVFREELVYVGVSGGAVEPVAVILVVEVGQKLRGLVSVGSGRRDVEGAPGSGLVVEDHGHFREESGILRHGRDVQSEAGVNGCMYQFLAVIRDELEKVIDLLVGD